LVLLLFLIYVTSSLFTKLISSFVSELCLFKSYLGKLGFITKNYAFLGHLNSSRLYSIVSIVKPIRSVMLNINANKIFIAGAWSFSMGFVLCGSILLGSVSFAKFNPWHLFCRHKVALSSVFISCLSGYDQNFVVCGSWQVRQFIQECLLPTSSSLFHSDT